MKETLKSDMKIPRGKPKSGRFWKSDKTPFSSMKQVKSLKSSWKEKMKLRLERKYLLAHDTELKTIKQKEIEEKKRKREEKKKRKEENQRKSEIVQVIRKTAKLKRLNKKQMRNIRKADTN